MKSTRGLRDIRLILVGFGTVGHNLAALLEQQRDELADRHHVAFSVVAIVTGHHGAVVNEQGVDLAWARRQPDLGPALDPLDVITTVDADVVMELTPLNITSGQPALTHIESALRHGKHVVTANKGPIACAHSHLSKLANETGRMLLFESTVLDGTPVFNLARHCLVGTRVTGFRGILNSTTNFILEELGRGSSLDTAIIVAQNRGFAEADPTLDIDGWDAAAKTAVLANVLLGANITPSDVERTGIGNITAGDVTRAEREGKCIKLVCEARLTDTELQGPTKSRSEPTVKARVSPQRVDRSDVLAQVHGTSSLLTLSTEHMGDITLVEHDPTPMQTAYGVLNDLLEIVSI